MTVRPIDRVADPTTFTAWEHVDRLHRDASVERSRTVVGRGGR